MSLLSLLEQQFQPINTQYACAQAFTRTSYDHQLQGLNVPYGHGRVHTHLLSYYNGRALSLVRLDVNTSFRGSNEWTVTSRDTFTAVTELNRAFDSLFSLVFDAIDHADRMDGESRDLPLIQEVEYNRRTGAVYDRECSLHKIIRSYIHVETCGKADLLNLLGVKS